MKIKTAHPMDVILYDNRPVIVASVEETEVLVSFVKPTYHGHTYGMESIKPDADVQLIYRDGWSCPVVSEPIAPESAQEPPDRDNPLLAQETVAVAVIKDSVVDSMRLFTGPHDEITRQAEEAFINECRERCTNWENYTPADVAEMIDNGYFCLRNGDSVCIYWPE